MILLICFPMLNSHRLHGPDESSIPTDNFYPNIPPQRSRLSRFDQPDGIRNVNSSSGQGGYQRAVGNEFGNNNGIGGGGGRRSGPSLLDRIDNPPPVPSRSTVPSKRDWESMDVDQGPIASMEGVESGVLDSMEGGGGDGRRFMRRGSTKGNPAKVKRRGGNGRVG
jgi:hypothetical protein